MRPCTYSFQQSTWPLNGDPSNQEPLWAGDRHYLDEQDALIQGLRHAHRSEHRRVHLTASISFLLLCDLHSPGRNLEFQTFPKREATAMD